MKILIVEDNEMNMKLFADILTYQKYEIDKAFNGKEAYDKLKGNRYDLVVLDIQLPIMDGFSVIKKLKEENIELPKILIASACAMDSDKLKAQEFGIKNYITKPIDIKKFSLTIKEMLEEKC